MYEKAGLCTHKEAKSDSEKEFFLFLTNFETDLHVTF